MKHFYTDFKGHRADKGENWSMFSFPNLYSEAIAKCRPGGTVIEIGTWVGRSLSYLAVEAINAKKNIKVVGIDLFEGVIMKNAPVNQWGLFKKYLTPVWKYLTVIKSDSANAAAFFNDVDFVFIDGDHSYEGVMRDLKAWWPKVSEHGIFAGHDIDLKNVKKAVDEFTQSLGLTYEVQERCWVIRK